MIDDKIREALEKRKSLHPEDDYNTEKCWLKEIDRINTNRTIDSI